MQIPVHSYFDAKPPIDLRAPAPPPTENGGEEQPPPDVIQDEDRFGHGFAMAGCMFIHLLGQRQRFELLDMSDAREQEPRGTLNFIPLLNKMRGQEQHQTSLWERKV